MRWTKPIFLFPHRQPFPVRYTVPVDVLLPDFSQVVGVRKKYCTHSTRGSLGFSARFLQKAKITKHLQVEYYNYNSFNSIHKMWYYTEHSTLHRFEILILPREKSISSDLIISPSPPNKAFNTSMLLIGIWINLTAYPMNPITRNPIPTALEIDKNSFDKLV
jgi:hypothetical protein